jgi:sRNA-binding protein
LVVWYAATLAADNLGRRSSLQRRISFVTRAKSPRISVAYAQLNAAFPLAFPLNDAEIRPLTVTIRDDLSGWIAAQPDSGAVRHLLGAMQRYCSRETYQRMVIAGTLRINLAGEPIEPVTLAGQAHAESRIAAMLAARAAKAQRLAAKLAQPKASPAPPKPKPQPKALPKLKPMSPVSPPPAQPSKAQALPTVIVKKRRTVVRPD